MASYNELNALIDAYINRNGVQAITGQILNGVLKAMVEQIGRGYAIMGVADLATDPGTPDAPESWFASTPGTYTNFGGLVVADAEFAIFSYTPQTETWEKTTLTEGIKQIICATHENGGHIPNVVASYEDGVLTLDFYNLQGLPGENATIDQVTANLVEDGGQPDASVATYGTESTKNFAFTFKNLKGDKGDTGVTSVVATVDNTTGTPTCTVSLVGQQLTLAFSGLKGAQGDTGSSVDYPFTIVNNLTTDDATQALSAAQGVVLQGEITQLEHKVDEITDGIELTVTTPKRIDLSGGDGTTVPSPSSAAGWGYYDAVCDEGAEVTVNGNGGNYGLWGFVDVNDKIISWSGTNVSGTNIKLIAPSGTKRVIVNTYDPQNYNAPVLILASSLQGQIISNANNIDKLEEDFGLSFNEKTVTPSIVTGKYITMSGSITSAPGYEYDSFDVEAGDIIKVSFTFVSGNLAAISLANSDLSVFYPQVQAVSGTHEYQYLCKEDGKVVISGVSSSLNYEVIHSRIDEQIQESGLPVAIKRVFPTFTITNGQYWNKSGKISSLGGWKRTSGAYLKKGSVIRVYWNGLNNPYISIITEVTSLDAYIRSCLLTPNPNVAGELSYCIDKDGYYSISNSVSDIYKYYIVEFANGPLFFNPPLDHLFLPTQDGLPREILRTPSFVGIVHKWGFIGDSLSSGEQAVKRDGTSTIERFDLYDYSWGQRLCKLNSVEGFNFSVGGQTTKGWCNGIDERTWAGAQLQENWKEAYCIALGVNDRSALSPGDADTDINLSDYTQNADTFAGWYAGIIQRLRSVNPKCRIFCLTIPYNNQQGYLDNNEVIRAIVPKFNKCYLIDLANYHWTPDGLGLNDHLSPAGYQWAAFEINTYIDWIIRNNLDDFKDIAWVGTEYSA